MRFVIGDRLPILMASQVWRSPLLGYLLAVFGEIMVVSGTLLLAHSFSTAAMQGALVLLVTLMVALKWGEGPGLLATIVGMAQLDIFVLFPQLPMSWRTMATGLCLALFWLISISLIADQSRRARHRAEELARAKQKGKRSRP